MEGGNEIGGLVGVELLLVVGGREIGGLVRVELLLVVGGAPPTQVLAPVVQD